MCSRRPGASGHHYSYLSSTTLHCPETKYRRNTVHGDTGLRARYCPGYQGRIAPQSSSSLGAAWREKLPTTWLPEFENLCKPAAIQAECAMSMQGRIRKCALTRQDQRARRAAALRQIAAWWRGREEIAEAPGSIPDGISPGHFRASA